jgi:hypothetical protein
MTGLVKNIALKNWKAAEFKAFCKLETVVKGRKPDELVAFSNKLLTKEPEVFLPFWNACVRGSCGEQLKIDR